MKIKAMFWAVSSMMTAVGVSVAWGWSRGVRLAETPELPDGRERHRFPPVLPSEPVPLSDADFRAFRDELL